MPNTFIRDDIPAGSLRPPPAARSFMRAVSLPATPMAERVWRGHTLCVHDPQGVEVICLHGALWITHDRDTEDRIVERGERYRPARDTRMWVHATTDSWLCLVPAHGD